MDKSSLFKIALTVTLGCLVVIGFAYTKNIFAQTATISSADSSYKQQSSNKAS